MSDNTSKEKDSENDQIAVACPNCFCDQGLQLDAEKIGSNIAHTCPNCGSKSSKMLTKDMLDELVYRFFTWGSLRRYNYGAAPRIIYNTHQKTSIKMTPSLERDVKIFERILGVGFFYYGPRAWMYGQITPLEALQNSNSRPQVIDRILREYPTVILTANEAPFYRVRKAPSAPHDYSQYDSPPKAFLGKGRLDTTDLPILYASPDLEVCVHECRVTVEDELYVATLIPTKSLRLINLAALLKEDRHVTEFESLDLAVHMLFMASSHSYEITREISIAARTAGFDGIIYPSYFSMARHGGMPCQAVVYGISNRRIPQFQQHEEAITVQNLALFGYPIRDEKIAIKCINKVTLTRVSYNFLFGPLS